MTVCFCSEFESISLICCSGDLQKPSENSAGTKVQRLAKFRFLKVYSDQASMHHLSVFSGVMERRMCSVYSGANFLKVPSDAFNEEVMFAISEDWFSIESLTQSLVKDTNLYIIFSSVIVYLVY